MPIIRRFYALFFDIKTTHSTCHDTFILMSNIDNAVKSVLGKQSDVDFCAWEEVCENICYWLWGRDTVKGWLFWYNAPCYTSYRFLVYKWNGYRFLVLELKDNDGSPWPKKRIKISLCKNIGAVVPQKLKNKRQLFRCRFCWQKLWNSHPDAIDRKAYYHFCTNCGKEFSA